MGGRRGVGVVNDDIDEHEQDQEQEQAGAVAVNVAPSVKLDNLITLLLVSWARRQTRDNLATSSNGWDETDW